MDYYIGSHKTVLSRNILGGLSYGGLMNIKCLAIATFVFGSGSYCSLKKTIATLKLHQQHKQRVN